MEAKLVVVSGAARPSEFKLKLPTIIGRSRTVDLPVAHPLISRQHCELFVDGDVLMIRDLGSLNGTFVQETRITEDTVLEPGDEFSVGPLTFKALYGKMPAAAAEDGDEADMSPPGMATSDSSEGADGDEEPPQFDDEESDAGPANGEFGDATVPAPTGHLADANGDEGEFDWLGEAPETPPASESAADSEEDFSLPDSADANSDTNFDSTIDIPRPAAPLPAKAAKGKSSAGNAPVAKPVADKAVKGNAEKAKPAKAKPAKAKPVSDKAKTTTPAEPAHAAAENTADASDQAAEDHDFAPPPSHQHGQPHGEPDLDNLFDFLQ